MLLQSVIEQSQSYLPYVFYDLQQNGSGLKILDPFYTYSVAYYDGYIYFGAQLHGGVPNNKASRIYKFPIGNAGAYQMYDIPNQPVITDTYDSHLMPILNFDPDGNLLVVREIGANSPDEFDGHNTDLLVYRTAIAGDILSIELINTITGFFSYPNVWVSGTNIGVGARGNASGFQSDEWYFSRSTDNGVSFTGNTVLNLGLDLDSRAYAQHVQNYDNGDYMICVNRRYDTLQTYNSVCFLKSSDGVTWQNEQGTFSKNVNTSGAITLAEMDANMLIWSKANDSYTVNFEGGVYFGGKPYLLASTSLMSGAEQTYEELRLYTYESGWVYEDLTAILPLYTHLWARNRMLQLSWFNGTLYIHVIDKSDPLCPLYEYRSTDGFATYTTTILDYVDVNHIYGSSTFNAQNDSERALIIAKRVGEAGEPTSYSDIKIYNQ